MEIQPFIEEAGFAEDLPFFKPVLLRDDLSLMVIGVGSPNTIFYLTSLLAGASFDRIIHVGIAGSYNSDLKLGDLVEIGEDRFADLGIDDNGTFSSLFDAGLTDPNMQPYKKGILVNPIQKQSGLPVVNGITVNTTTGSNELLEQWKSLYQPDVESMEGAAALFVCLQLNIPIIQIRSISNVVEPRNRDSWKMDLAIHKLNDWLMNFVKPGDQK